HQVGQLRSHEAGHDALLRPGAARRRHHRDQDPVGRARLSHSVPDPSDLPEQPAGQHPENDADGARRQDQRRRSSRRHRDRPARRRSPVRRSFMPRKMLRLACAVVTLSNPAFAQQSPPQPGNAPAPSAKADVESAIPLTPGMIRDLGRRVGDNRRAEEEVNTEIASPISRRVNVSFAPGQSTPIVRIVKGYPTALSFFDRTGQPWPIEWDTNSNPAGQANNGNCNQGPAGGGGPAVASVGFYVCTPTAGSNVLQVAAASLQPRGGLLVTLKGAPKPISFMLVAGGGTYDADLTVQVAERGPNAVTGTTAPPRLRRSAERDLRSDLIMRGALIPCIRPGMMPTLISGSRQSRGC